MIHATELIDANVTDTDNNYVGRIRDLCLIPSEQSSRIGLFVIARGRYQPLVARFDQVDYLGPGTVRLNTGELQLATYYPDESWLTLRRDLFDQQIIDTAGHKVVRVNDLNLTERRMNSHCEVHIVQVDVGFAGALRRLLKGIVSSRWIRAIQDRIPTRTIPWDAVDIIEADPMRRVKLRLPKAKLLDLHPADIADIIEELPLAQQEAVIEELDDETAAETLEEVKDDVQVRILETLDRKRIAHILEEMHPDEAVDALAELSAETARQVLDGMDRKEANELVHLMQYEQDTAGGMMTTEFFQLVESATVEDALAEIRRSDEELETLDTVYLHDGAERDVASGQLTGVVAAHRLLLSKAATKLQDIQDERMTTVVSDATEDDVADLFDKYNLRSLPVIDDQHRLLGIITVDDIVSRLWKRQN